MTMPKHTLEDVRAEYNRLDDLCMVDTSFIDLRVSTRATRRYGYCHYKSRANFGAGGYIFVPDYICITDFILDCEEQFWNTIRHEYAHALVMLRDGKSHHHDSVWKAACLEVGCNPERVAKNQEAEQKSVERRKTQIRYIVHCRDCGRQWAYIRRGSVVKALKAKKVCTCLCGGHNISLYEIEKEKNKR